VFTNSKGLSGVVFSRPEWNDLTEEKRDENGRIIRVPNQAETSTAQSLMTHCPVDPAKRQLDMCRLLINATGKKTTKQFGQNLKREVSKYSQIGKFPFDRII
jgi:hypothetical protein